MVNLTKSPSILEARPSATHNPVRTSAGLFLAVSAEAEPEATLDAALRLSMGALAPRSMLVEGV